MNNVKFMPKNRGIWIAGLFVALFLGMGLWGFYFGGARYVAELIEKIRLMDEWKFKVVNMVGLLLFAVPSAVIGFFMAKKRRRSQYAWIGLCLLFNVWALLVLWRLPRIKEGFSESS
ncbi:MAG: hypothetical protein OEV59_03435 [Deltaproteobacteria bacterium]|nr:hypothetical protein [Deltaproteobacteria bacterium]